MFQFPFRTHLKSAAISSLIATARHGTAAISAGLAAGAVALLPTASSAAEFACNGPCYFVQAVSSVAGLSAVDGPHAGGPIFASVDQAYSSFGRFSNMSASADLASGALRARIDTNYAGVASAALSEQIMFDLPFGMTSADILVKWTVEGSNKYDSPNSRANGLAARFSITGFGGTGGTDTINFDALNSKFNTPTFQEFVSEGFHRFAFEDILTVKPGQLLRIDAFLQAGIFGPGTMDYGNTSFFSFEIPEGVVLNSSSGALLSRPIRATVPEPTTWAMMILGFGSAGAAIRRSRKGSLLAVKRRAGLVR